MENVARRETTGSFLAVRNANDINMRPILLTFFLVAFNLAHAQVKSNTGKPQQRPLLNITNTGGQLQSRGSYQARSAPGTFRIADPTINALNGQGYGGPVKMYGSDGVLGLPRGTYGYAKGQLWLRSTDATSIGGSTGNSTVGTGSSNAGVGVSGSAPGVNGKAPDAGPAIWGSARGLLQPTVPAKAATNSGKLQ